ncbi:hypothetical protein PENTCL1PPCAC_28434 [Pristionchus entomophagus]|uniref:Lipocalin domain-containing protein n=1 Tax=Pristionchus entomophagus TaxID=358040 RepID=A0AAV5UGT5_9BILA|nr:hypothetical protein PENTCL1PPCAC_28434 [Pristionchus entomophagus]
MRLSHLVAASLLAVGLSLAQHYDSSQPVVIRLEPQRSRPSFFDQISPPRAVAAPPQPVVAAAPQPMIPQQQPQQAVMQPPPPPPMSLQPQPAAASPFGGAPPAPSARQPVFAAAGAGEQQFVPAELNPGATPPPPPPVTLPTDVQNQLIKFFGLDSFGIPGLTGNHPNGFAGAVQELRAAGVPVQGLPANHIPGVADNGMAAMPPNDVLAQANPNFANTISQIYKEVNNPAQFGTGSGTVALPEATPGENGLIGLLSTSIRKLVKETGVADALSQSIPSVLGTQAQQDGPVTNARSPSRRAKVSESQDDSPRTSQNKDAEIRRQPSAAQRALSGIAAALGGGGSNSPTHAGLPRIPGIPLLPGGIPRNSQGQIDVVQLIGAITRRVSNGTTLADVLPPEQLQTLADNVTDALLPSTPEHFEMSKLMGRWFEGINSPRATEQRCVVHHYGGLTKNDKTATFTALKIYREGSEFGPVRYSIGYAFRSGNKDSMLQLHSSETSDAQPFWIYKLGPEGKDPFGNPQYEYAIVSNWVKYPVTVLVRDPDTFKAKYEVEVLRWLEDQGFINGFIRAFNLLQPASYSSCQYADSTFEVFGK